MDEIDDRWIRAVGVPGFGLAIPQLTGLFGPLGWRDAAAWWGQLWFIALAAAIWQGNRWLLFQQRRRWDWLDHPVRKLVMLVAAIVFYTAPLTAAAIWAWYRAAGLPLDLDALRAVTLMNVICVVFVTHAYETIFLIKARENDQVRAARLEKARVQAELEALHAQIDPHFLFNSLNTMASLIESDPARAREFNERLARVYRYILASRGRPLVTLAEELAFVDDYAGLLALRFGGGLRIERAVAPGVDPERLLMPPIALQVLVENVVKHNALDETAPLAVRLAVRAGEVELVNERRERAPGRPSARVGLRNLNERYKLVVEREISVDAGRERFGVRLPLLELGA
jgi:hypothetical protein